MAKGKKKLTGKSAKAKRRPAPLAEKQLRFEPPPGLREALRKSDAQGERYSARFNSPQAIADRALLDRAMRQERFGPAALPAATPTKKTAESKHTARQMNRALWALGRLYPRDRYPQGVPEAVSTTTLEQAIKAELESALAQAIKAELENEAKRRTEKKAGLEKRTEKLKLTPPPSYRVVAKARKVFNAAEN